MKLLRRKHAEPSTQPDAVAVAPVCEHVVLIPRWDRAVDIGREEAASMYRCESCGRDFSPEEAVKLRETEKARVQGRVAS